MSAQDVREDLKAYLDGELAEDRAAEVRRAIEEDSSLLGQAEFLQRIGSSLQSMNMGPEPTGGEVARTVSLTPKRRWLSAPLGIAAAVACLLIGIVVVRGLNRMIVKRISFSTWSEETAPDSVAPADLKEGQAPTGLERQTLKSKDEGIRPSMPAAAESLDRAVVRTGTLSLRVANLEQSEGKI
nr:zf-HC2 domain-containing protein [Armatimonadota bacterium]